MMTLSNKLQNLTEKKTYWLAYLAVGCLLLTVALYSQHISGELPCVVCIQIRLWVTLLVMVAAIGLSGRSNFISNGLVHISLFLISIGLVERSYLLLGTERGFIFADCGFDLGLPTWFAIEDWLPWLYRIETSCGYTPELLFGVTMAEALMVLSVLLLLLSLCMTLVRLVAIKGCLNK